MLKRRPYQVDRCRACKVSFNEASISTFLPLRPGEDVASDVIKLATARAAVAIASNAPKFCRTKCRFFFCVSDGRVGFQLRVRWVPAYAYMGVKPTLREKYNMSSVLRLFAVLHFAVSR